MPEIKKAIWVKFGMLYEIQFNDSIPRKERIRILSEAGYYINAKASNTRVSEKIYKSIVELGRLLRTT